MAAAGLAADGIAAWRLHEWAADHLVAAPPVEPPSAEKRTRRRRKSVIDSGGGRSRSRRKSVVTRVGVALEDVVGSRASDGSFGRASAVAEEECRNFVVLWVEPPVAAAEQLASQLISVLEKPPAAELTTAGTP